MRNRQRVPQYPTAPMRLHALYMCLYRGMDSLTLLFMIAVLVLLLSLYISLSEHTPELCGNLQANRCEDTNRRRANGFGTRKQIDERILIVL